MTHTMNKSVRGEEGFTLVELAVVMIIIGLLVGGILKGQEMIANAQVTSTVAQVKSIDAATSTFTDMFDAMPGDMLNPGGRLTNCTAAGSCNVAGDGDNRLNAAPFAAAGTEGQTFFIHLSAADLLGGIDPNGGVVWGGIYMEANIEGGFIPSYWNGGALGQNAVAKRGHYLSLVSTAGAASANDTLTPSQAFRIDNKMDDGVPTTGSVFVNAGGACINGTNYNESADAATCDLALRFQG